MIRIPSRWLSGFVIAESKLSGSRRLLILECWSPEWDSVNLKIRLLDRDRNEVCSKDCQMEVCIKTQWETLAVGKIPFGKRYERATTIFRSRRFRRVRARIEIPESIFKNSVYFVLNLAQSKDVSDASAFDRQWYSECDCIHLETDRRNLQKNRSGTGHILLLTTREHANARMVEIMETFPRLRWQDRITSTAASSLHTRLFNGTDSPLLTDRVANRLDFRRIIFGAIKFARTNAFSKRGNRKADRFETGVFLDRLAPPEYVTSYEPAESDIDKDQLTIALRHIEEVAGNAILADLLRRDIQGEDVAKIVGTLGMDIRNVQVRLSRQRKRLVLPRRRKDSQAN